MCAYGLLPLLSKFVLLFFALFNLSGKSSVFFFMHFHFFPSPCPKCRQVDRCLYAEKEERNAHTAYSSSPFATLSNLLPERGGENRSPSGTDGSICPRWEKKKTFFLVLSFGPHAFSNRFSSSSNVSSTGECATANSLSRFFTVAVLLSTRCEGHRVSVQLCSVVYCWRIKRPWIICSRRKKFAMVKEGSTLSMKAATCKKRTVEI